MKVELEEDGRRIILGDNTGGGAVMLRSVRFLVLQIGLKPDSFVYSIQFTIYIAYTQKNGAVSKVTKKSISHLTRAQRTPSAAATVVSIRGKRLKKQVAVCSSKTLRCNDHPVHSSSSTRCTKFVMELEFLWIQPTPR